MNGVEIVYKVFHAVVKWKYARKLTQQFNNLSYNETRPVLVMNSRFAANFNA